MKVPVSLLAGLAALALVASPALASDPAVVKTSKKPTPAKASHAKKPQKPQRVLITGSNIPELIEPGKNHVTASHVVIMGSSEIGRTGARTATELLNRLPNTR